MSMQITPEDADTTEDLCAEVLGSSEIDDVLLEFRDEENAFSVEFVDFESGRWFNVAGPVPEDIKTEIVANVDLPIEEINYSSVLIESTAEDAAEAASQLEEIATAAGMSLDDAMTAEFKNIERGGVLGWIASKIKPRK